MVRPNECQIYSRQRYGSDVSKTVMPGVGVTEQKRKRDKKIVSQLAI